MSTRTLPSEDVVNRACDAVLDGDDDAFLDENDFAAELALAAGELAAAVATPLPVPASLHERLLAQVDGHVSPATSTMASKALSSGSTPKKPRTPWARRASVAWVAAAAAAVIAIVGWWPKPSATAVPVPTTAAPTVAELRTQLLAKPGTTTLTFGATDDVAARGATGDVVWNSVTQTGVMRIRGLAKNQSAIEQYQLWIFDAARDDRYPVDGGVFDIDGDDVIIAIHAAITVDTPTLFAVTVEKPGGVVVSDRSRIVLAAKVG